MWNMVYDTSWMLMKDLDVSCVQRAGPYFHFFPTAVFFFSGGRVHHPKPELRGNHTKNRCEGRRYVRRKALYSNEAFLPQADESRLSDGNEGCVHMFWLETKSQKPRNCESVKICEDPDVFCPSKCLCCAVFVNQIARSLIHCRLVL